MLITDVKLDGKIDGLELANFVRQSYPEIQLVVTSGDAPARLPDIATFVPKSWRREDMLCQARRVLHYSPASARVSFLDTGECPARPGVRRNAPQTRSIRRSV